MTPISEYSSSSAIRLLLQGDPKSGKSCLAAQWPGAYFIDCDVNLQGPIRWLKEKGLTLPVGFDVLDHDETGKEVPMPQRYTRFGKLFNEAEADERVHTIVIDSATSFVDVLMEETKRLNPGVKDGRQLFGIFFMYGKALMDKMKKCRKHIIFIAHERMITDEKGNIVLPYRVAWPGQLGQIIGSFFTDVWRCEVEQVPSGMTTSYKWVVRTMPNYAYKLGNSLGLPEKFEFKWELVQAKLDAIAKA